MDLENHHFESFFGVFFRSRNATRKKQRQGAKKTSQAPELAIKSATPESPLLPTPLDNPPLLRYSNSQALKKRFPSSAAPRRRVRPSAPRRFTSSPLLLEPAGGRQGDAKGSSRGRQGVVKGSPRGRQGVAKAAPEPQTDYRRPKKSVRGGRFLAPIF